MSSLSSSGYYAEQASQAMDTECDKSDDKKHAWVQQSERPRWDECKHCKKPIYWK